MKRVLLIALCLANLLNASTPHKNAKTAAELVRLTPPSKSSYSSQDSKQNNEKICHATASFMRIGDDIGIGYVDITIKFLTNHTPTKVGRSVNEKGIHTWIENVDPKDFPKYSQDLALLDAIIADCRKRDARTLCCVPYQNEDDVERRYTIYKDGNLEMTSEKPPQS